ncbi:hypothetical protein [Lentilactobacillus sp. SPB1-3]|uniref:Uncharacterized protein n=1 Tax=Lentilactobacillus terminaliae TaxID=3003483 RepID=A0ACD5DCJ1_9LACO|nr:hypothetical protein [Lentilactobacillus sp. SPB1-3]MCZ0978111.1 hypothetical protein [Lentilactobacillus sp. SPB1-3]
MTYQQILKIVTDAFTWLISGGATLVLAWFLKNRRVLFGILQTFADHTKTKKDNELIARLKADAETLVTAIQPFDLPGTEQKAMASQRLITSAKRFGKDITPQQANDYIEEAYQKNYGITKPVVKGGDINA